METAATMKMLNLNEPCGCGNPTRYFVRVSDNELTSSCNKYMRCLTYDEMSEALKHANQLLQAYRMKREVDGLNGRTWSASKHFEAEALIEKLEAK